MKRLRAFWADPSAATAAEFALILPVALLFLLGSIDVGRYFWSINRLEKAVQLGTRYAVVTGLVAGDLNAEDYVGFDCDDDADTDNSLRPGDKICKEALGKIVCTSATCSCAQGNCPTDLSNIDTTAFNNIVGRMRVVAPQITSANVRVIYTGSGLGFAGDPRENDGGDSLSQISPVVTVQVLNQRMRVISLLGMTLRLPSFQYSQTLEDGEGAIAY